MCVCVCGWAIRRRDKFSVENVCIGCMERLDNSALEACIKIDVLSTSRSYFRSSWSWPLCIPRWGFFNSCCKVKPSPQKNKMGDLYIWYVFDLYLVERWQWYCDCQDGCHSQRRSKAVRSQRVRIGSLQSFFKSTTTQRRSRLQHWYCVGVNMPKRYRQVKDLP